MQTVTLNGWPIDNTYSKFYFRLNIDNKDFYIKMSANWKNLKECILYKNTIYVGPDVLCTCGNYHDNVRRYLMKFSNDIQEEQENMSCGKYIVNLYSYKEIKDKENVIKDKLFDFYAFSNNIDKLTKDNFIELCFRDREKKDMTKYYLSDDAFIERLSESEIMVWVSGGRYIKKVKKNKKGEEYINSGNMNWHISKFYLKDNQKYIKK